MRRLRELFVGGSDGNARLTAGVGLILTVLLVLEGLTLFAVRQLLLPHIFLGLLLVPPVLLKLASTGWRMLAYYRRRGEYLRRGPPPALLRMLVAPVLVVTTITLLATGIAAAAVGHGGILLGLHKASFVVWGLAFGVHFLAHVLKLPPLLVGDWWRADRLAGRRVRRYLLTTVVVAGLVVAVAAVPLAHGWHQPFERFGGGE
jgi:hypothetical protein